MEIDKWVSGYKVYSTPLHDGKRIYFHVEYYAPGQSLAQPPVWEKIVYLTNNDAAETLLRERLDSFTNFVARMHIDAGNTVVLTAE